MFFSFVILHYNSIEETVKCVGSILKYCSEGDYNIIIVDNASTNSSYSLLTGLYKENTKITLLHNEINLGFARGNNVGISYALEKYSPDFIIMLNNDIELINSCFLERIKTIYMDNKFGVLGPMIITPDGRCDTNPFDVESGKEYYSVEKINRTISYCEKQLKLIRYHLKWLYDKVNHIKEKLLSNKDVGETQAFKDRHYNVLLHGSCLIFSKKYFEKWRGLDERTFMYGEENIIHLRCLAENILMMYSPEIVVFHNEHATVKREIEKDKNKFFYENLLQSSKVLKDVYICYDGEKKKSNKVLY